VLASIGTSIETTLTGLDNLATTIATIVEVSEQKFPYVYIPKFGVHVAKSLSLTSAIGTYHIPVVPLDQRKEWEAYAARNNTYVETWIEDVLALQNNWSGE
jgi:hypothetical protein